MPMDDLLQAVPKLISRIDSLELDLKQTKLTMGSAIVKLVKKVKKLEGFLKRRNLVLTDSIWSEIGQQKISKRLAGKELSNPLIADDLLKIIWLSMYHGLTNLNIDYQDWSAMKTSCCQDLKS
ncbi:hypothetical protein Tco_0551916 [Tanacetum coccineum]